VLPGPWWWQPPSRTTGCVLLLGLQAEVDGQCTVHLISDMLLKGGIVTFSLLSVAPCQSVRNDQWGLSCAGLTKVNQGQPIEDLCPDGSYVIPFQKLNKETFDKQVQLCSTPFTGHGSQKEPAFESTAMLMHSNILLGSLHSV
jgi:hypothetical protein